MATNCGPGYGCTLHYDVHFYPRMIAGLTYVRAPLDEELPGGAYKLSWFEDPLLLPLHTKAVSANGSRLWEPNHQRGLTRKYGSSSLPASAAAVCGWLP